jgi:hypothetical protein
LILLTNLQSEDNEVGEKSEKLNFSAFLESFPVIASNYKIHNEKDILTKIYFLLEKMSLSEGVLKSLNRNQNL